MAVATGDFDPEAFKRWTPEAQARAAEALRAKTVGEVRYWYCTNPGRACDGKPHDGYPYKHARSDQWPPVGDWSVWAILSGRGSGKTRSGSEWVRKMSERVPAIALVGRRGVDIRDTMVEGVGEEPENGAGLILACERAGVDYLWEPSKKLFTFDNGCVAIGISAEEPDSLRGKNFSAAWLDEPAHMPLIEDVWSMLRFTMRQKQKAGGRARTLVTTTPRPTKWIKSIVAKDTTRVVRVSTYANRDNLDPTYIEETLGDFAGTRLGRQEIEGEILADVEGSLWREEHLRSEKWVDIGFDRIVIGIDPAGTANKRSDETGIIVAARKGNLYYVIEDGSGRLSPEAWGTRAQSLYAKHLADAMVPEKNYGGDMVMLTLRSMGVSDAVRIKPVTARRGKALRAEPIVALYEQGRVIHMPYHDAADLSELETEMVEWVPGVGESPNRVDALVHALTELAGMDGGASGIAAPRGVAMRGPRVPYGMPDLSAYRAVPSQA